MSEAAERNTFRLSSRLSVELTCGAGGLTVEWAPAMPARLTRNELRRYRAARHQMIEELAKRLGAVAVVVEV